MLSGLATAAVVEYENTDNTTYVKKKKANRLTAQTKIAASNEFSKAVVKIQT